MTRQAVDSIRLNVVGIDLLEQETAENAAAFANAYGIAREAGLGLRAHAGEGAGGESVWDVIRKLNVSRIAHGTRAIEDPELVEYLAEKKIALDMCPTSNYRLNVVDAIKDHPIRQLFNVGVRVTLSSDDPLFFRSNLTGELMLLQEKFGFEIKDLLRLQRNAIDSAFLSPERKKKLYARLDEYGGRK
jgi:adenosine deaminase